jgi:hypothetical protein
MSSCAAASIGGRERPFSRPGTAACAGRAASLFNLWVNSVSYLVYCVLNGYRGPARPSPRGVRAQTVWVLECGDICAAVSQEMPQPGPDVQSVQHAQPGQDGTQTADLVAYARVVEAFNRGETVVPVRYGCRFVGVADVRSWLHRSAAHLRSLLHRLDGCVEMGVRALTPDAPPAGRSASLDAGFASALHYAGGGGAAPSIQTTPCLDRVAQLVREAFFGRFRECVAQTRQSERRAMLSLHFLVERSRLAAFREAFGRIVTTEAALKLSGPWAPYNFASGAIGGAEPVPSLSLPRYRS